MDELRKTAKGTGLSPARGIGLHYQLYEPIVLDMVSVNSVIIIGSLGRVSRSSLDESGQTAFDNYFAALAGLRSAFDDLNANAFAEAARRLREASRLLRKLAGRLPMVKARAAFVTTAAQRNAASFHAAKVDARNLP